MEVDMEFTPDEEDYLLTPTGYLGSSVGVSVVGGKGIGSFPDIQEALSAIKQDMEKNNCFPTIWWESDHGNYWPIDSEGNEIQL